MDEARFRDAERRYWDHEGVTPTEEWLDLPTVGARVRVQVVGDGPPVLFVHGVNVNGTCWAPLVARLGSFRCLVLDRPGCGLSEPLREPVDDVDAFAELTSSLLVDVLDGFELERAPVVSTSLGSAYGLRSAAAHPERIERLLAMGWTVGAPNGHLPLFMRLAGVRPLGRAMARLPVNDRIARSMLARIGLRQALESGRLSAEGVGWFKALINHTDTMRNDLAAAPPIMRVRGGLGDEIALHDDLLGRIRVPTRFLWGDGDPFGGADVATAFVARIPGAELEILPGGHAIWMDDPDRVATLTGRFLADAG